MNGILVINKPQDYTSSDIAKVEKNKIIAVLGDLFVKNHLQTAIFFV